MQIPKKPKLSIKSWGKSSVTKFGLCFTTFDKFETIFNNLIDLRITKFIYINKYVQNLLYKCDNVKLLPQNTL